MASKGGKTEKGRVKTGQISNRRKLKSLLFRCAIWASQELRSRFAREVVPTLPVFGSDSSSGERGSSVRADFREGDEDSNFSIFRVRRFTEWPEPLH